MQQASQRLLSAERKRDKTCDRVASLQLQLEQSKYDAVQCMAEVYRLENEVAEARALYAKHCGGATTQAQADNVQGQLFQAVLGGDFKDNDVSTALQVLLELVRVKQKQKQISGKLGEGGGSAMREDTTQNVGEGLDKRGADEQQVQQGENAVPCKKTKVQHCAKEKPEDVNMEGEGLNSGVGDAPIGVGTDSSTTGGAASGAAKADAGWSAETKPDEERLRELRPLAVAEAEEKAKKLQRS